MIKGGLKLKREVAAATPVIPIGELIVAHIWVDASVYHLDGEFSYLIPGDMAGRISPGTFVSVPFHGREIIGVVLRISERGELAGLKSISRIIGKTPLLTETMLKLIGTLSARYACHPFDLIRSAVPDRVAMIEKKYSTEMNKPALNHISPASSFLQLPPMRSRTELIAQKIMEYLKSGPTLVLLPDLRELTALSEFLIDKEVSFVQAGSHLPKSENFENFLKALYGEVNLVIGTRSAVFSPLHNLSNILIYNEGSEHFYERRTPGWNVRDVALLRSELEKINVSFVGYSPSVEIARLIEEKRISYRSTRSKVYVETHPSVNGELLPSRALSSLRKALAAGPVLFLVPLKGYAQAIRCQKCRTISRCECGGAHEQLSARAHISCNHCNSVVKEWRCSWCHHKVPALLSRGIERHHLELGKLFPGTKIQISTADHLVSHPVSAGIAIATPGCAPLSASGYSAVCILEGNRFLNQPDMRSSERIREFYFSHAALVNGGGKVILVQDEGDQIATALATWNPSIAVARDLEERNHLSLPPYVRTAHLTMDTSEIVRFRNALLVAQEEGRIPRSTRILGPIPAGEKSALILTVSIAEGEALISTLHEFMRRRSASKKTLPSLKVDPYSLSR